MKEYSALHKYFNTINYCTHYRLQNATILKFLLMFPHNEFCMQKVACYIYAIFEDP